MRLLLADLRHHLGSWAWTCVVAVVAGACVAGQLMVMHGSLTSAAGATDLTSWGTSPSNGVTDAAYTVAGFIISCVVLATATVLAATASLAVTQGERDHGLWLALGMSPGTLRVVLLGQLALVGAVGSLGGSLLGVPVARIMVPLLVDQEVTLPGAAIVPAAGTRPCGAPVWRRSRRAAAISPSPNPGPCRAHLGGLALAQAVSTSRRELPIEDPANAMTSKRRSCDHHHGGTSVISNSLAEQLSGSHVHRWSRCTWEPERPETGAATSCRLFLETTEKGP